MAVLALILLVSRLGKNIESLFTTHYEELLNKDLFRFAQSWEQIHETKPRKKELWTTLVCIAEANFNDERALYESNEKIQAEMQAGYDEQCDTEEAMSALGSAVYAFQEVAIGQRKT